MTFDLICATLAKTVAMPTGKAITPPEVHGLLAIWFAANAGTKQGVLS